MGILPPKTKSSIRTLLLPKVLEKSLSRLYNEYYKYKILMKIGLCLVVLNH